MIFCSQSLYFSRIPRLSFIILEIFGETNEWKEGWAHGKYIRKNTSYSIVDSVWSLDGYVFVVIRGSHNLPSVYNPYF